MKKVLLIISLFISGCSTTTPVPIVPEFPSAPKSLMEKCPPLKKIDGDNIVLSSLTKIIIENYSLYHQCAVKVDEWQKWHQEQQKIFNDID